MLRIFGVLLVSGLVACSGDKAADQPAFDDTVPKASEFGSEPERPYVQLVAKPAEFKPGDEVRIVWRTGDAAKCVAEGAWSGEQTETGVLEITPDWSGIRQYGLVCATDKNRAGEVRGSVVIKSAPPAPEPAAETEEEPASTELLGDEGGIVIQ